MSARDVSIDRQLDAICNEFEANWVAETYPDFEAYLNRIGPSYGDRLLGMLLHVDIELRNKAGQQVKADQYQVLGEHAVAVACLKALPLNPIERYTTCQDFADDLSHAIQETSDGVNHSARANLQSGFQLGKLGCNIRVVISLIVLFLLLPSFFFYNNIESTLDLRKELKRLNAEFVVDSQDHVTAVIADDSEIENHHLLLIAREDSIVKLGLRGTNVSDNGLKYLYGLNNLREVDLTGTMVTSEGISSLKKELPDCTIVWQPLFNYQHPENR